MEFFDNIKTVQLFFKIQSGSVLIPLFLNIYFLWKHITQRNRNQKIFAVKTKVHINESWLLALYFLFTFIVTGGLNIFNLSGLDNTFFAKLHAPIELIVYCGLLSSWVNPKSKILKHIIIAGAVAVLLMGLYEKLPSLQSIVELVIIIGFCTFTTVSFFINDKIPYKKYYKKMIVGIAMLCCGYSFYAYLLYVSQFGVSYSIPPAYMQIFCVITGYVLIGLSTWDKLRLWS